MKIGSLCSGYGGLDIAVERVFNAETAWFAEYDAAPSKVLAYRWPGVPNHGDMTAIEWAAVEPVDIIAGGTPCQDLSAAGKRKGMTEGTRSNLWVQMREAVAQIRPQYVIWENVRGAFSATADSEMEREPGLLGDRRSGPALRALGRVLGDLASLGYDSRYGLVRASDAGAPHGRARVFLVAHTADHSGNRAGNARNRWPELADRYRAAPHPLDQRRDGRTETTQGGDIRSTVAGDNATPWGKYGPAIRRWESITGRNAPAPTRPDGRNGQRRLNPALPEWMMGLPAGWVTDRAIGLSRKEQLKAIGNGVSPAQAELALSMLLSREEVPA